MVTCPSKNHIMWQFICAHTDTGNSYTRSLLNQINNCIPWLDKNRGGKYHRLKKYPHTAAQMSRELAGEGIWQETLLKVQLLWIRLPPRLLPPSLPSSHLPPTRRQQINCHKWLFSSQTIFSFTRELSAPFSLTRQCKCWKPLYSRPKWAIKTTTKKERKLVVNIQCRLHKRPFVTCFPLVRHFRIFGSMTSSRKEEHALKKKEECLWFNTRTDFCIFPFSGNVALL